MTIVQKTIVQISAYVACLGLLLLAPELAYSQRSSELSDDLPDSRTMAVQQKVDGLFEAENYKRAFFIYRKELAPLGDKYAQYMVGYMLETGLGVDEDSVSALAWYRLAAERDTPEFIAVTEQLMRKMSAGEIRRSDIEYASLRLKYCDLAVLLASIKRDFKELGVKTGSRLRSDSGSVTIVETRSGRTRSGADYYGTVYGNLQDRLNLLIEIGEFEDIDDDPTHLNIRELERLVVEHIQLQD
jgi:hypothetical protein